MSSLWQYPKKGYEETRDVLREKEREYEEAPSEDLLRELTNLRADMRNWETILHDPSWQDEDS